MGDPVVAADGHTYERRAIERWLRTRRTSPMTGQALRSRQVTDNFTLRSMIREFVEFHTMPHGRAGSPPGFAAHLGAAATATPAAQG